MEYKMHRGMYKAEKESEKIGTLDIESEKELYEILALLAFPRNAIGAKKVKNGYQLGIQKAGEDEDGDFWDEKNLEIVEFQKQGDSKAESENEDKDENTAENFWDNNFWDEKNQKIVEFEELADSKVDSITKTGDDKKNTDRLQRWGKEIGRLSSKRIVEKIDDMKRSHDENFRILNHALDHISGNFGNINFSKIYGEIQGEKMNEKIVEEIKIINENESDRHQIYQYVINYLFNDLGAVIEKTKKDNYNWSDLRNQIDHN